jgi:hypothetical protein
LGNSQQKGFLSLELQMGIAFKKSAHSAAVSFCGTGLIFITTSEVAL